MTAIRLPTISVVIPSYNQGRFLRDALESIFRQNYPHVEVVVIDGGSTDESVRIIREYESRLKFWRSHRDDGQTAAINEGMSHCSGEIVAWLNSDDLYWGDALWTVARAYNDHPGYGLYIGNGLRFNQSEGAYSPFAPLHVTLNRAALIQGLDYILQPSTFFLRTAWEAVGGLQNHLHYIMDWDVVIRIADRYPAVLINEFLAVSREYDATKTSTGSFKRAFEIIQVLQKYGNTQITAGAAFYWFETLLNAQTGDIEMPDVRALAWEAMLNIFKHFQTHYGGLHGFPEVGDAQDVYYIPRSRHALPAIAKVAKQTDLPSITIVIPSFNQGEFIGRTLESIVSQKYPRLEVWIMDGGSTDSTREIVKQFAASNIKWISEPDRGPAHAINRGLRRASGELLAWLGSDDLLAVDALWNVAQAFIDKPETELVYANALYIDEHDELFLAHHGTHRTGLYYGRMEARELIPAYWKYVHSVPQPTVFFRRRLYLQHGGLNENYKFIFDFELFFRFASANVQKLERTTALYRIHTRSKTGGDWSNFLIELYRFSRPMWPRISRPEFRATLRSFLTAFMNRKLAHQPRRFRFWAIASLVALSTITGIGNPESWGQKRRRQNAQAQLPDHSPQSAPNQTLQLTLSRQFTAHFCSLTYPLTPGYSGGEIRDFHILRHLVTISDVKFWTLYDLDRQDRRTDVLRPYIAHVHPLKRPVIHRMKDKIATQASVALPQEVAFHHRRAQAVYEQLQHALENEKPDFLFVSPQTNPVGLLLNKAQLQTRFVMASYDVEAVRIERLSKLQQERGEKVEADELARSKQFETRSLAAYDGIIAVSALDKRIFAQRYDFPAERILVLENSVDTAYFAFEARTNRENIVLTGTMSYPPNRQAALRLIERIMPLVWAQRPNAKLWLVGQFPAEALTARHDGDRVFVTGRVDDIRVYLANAAMTCAPLEAGSGTKYKLLESMSAGVPVICSSLAAEGLNLTHDVHALIHDTDSAIADAIIALLDRPDVGEALAKNGRRLVENEYSWDANLPKLDAWLHLLRQLPMRMAAPSGS